VARNSGHVFEAETPLMILKSRVTDAIVAVCGETGWGEHFEPLV
jgi:hypothetical protein